MKKYIQIIDGPNLNLTGKRQVKIFGEEPVEAVVKDMRKHYNLLEIEVRHYQSNVEGELINKLQESGYDNRCLGIILNGGAYTHTSIALADAVAAIPASVIEVHISNIYRRGKMRSKSFLAPVCKGSITGFGLDSYKLAADAILREHNLSVRV